MVGHDGHQRAWHVRFEHLGRHACGFLAGGYLPSVLQGTAVQAVFLEKLPQGHFGDAEVPRPLDKVEQFVACGLGMGEEKLGDGARMAR